MKIGRNNLCPCGSGKKYKKCCYLKNNNLDTETNLKESDADDDADNYGDDFLNLSENFNEQAFLLQTIDSLRRFSLDRKSHIKEYYKIRKMHSEIINTMISYHEANKFELKIDNNYIYNNEHPIINNETFHLIESNFDFETREGVQALYDLLIYKVSHNLSCITEDFIKSHRYRKPEKIEFLHSMLDSTIGLFEITKTDINEGYVYLKDIFTDIEYKIVDIALSGNHIYDNFYMYTRLIKYHDIIFNTGLSLTFTKKDGFIKNHIRNHKKNYASEEELIRFIQLYNYYSRNPNKMKIFTNILK
ncbi:MAG: SEC-C metal-binding domain-containing protein [Sedimentibacter sp.]